MPKLKSLVLTAVVAVSALIVGATPVPAVAEVTATESAVVMLADGFYWIKDSNGNIIGYIIVRNGQVVDGQVWTAP